MNNTYSQNEYRGHRGILLARCSTARQVKYSVPRQIEDMQEFRLRVGMEVAEEIKLEGVSGMKPHARSDIQAILHRKRTKNDFDFVVIAAVDRLTRGGPKHGFWILF